MINRAKLQHILEYAKQQRHIGLHCKVPPEDMVKIVEMAMLQGEAVQLVGEVVAWNAPVQQGVYRNVDFRWIDINVAPGTKLYALKNEELTGVN
ncbi:TPA: hypothetical protein PRR23_004095 [Escherichia coli]|nr:hypothetical protein [Escherichia coli]